MSLIIEGIIRQIAHVKDITVGSLGVVHFTAIDYKMAQIRTLPEDKKAKEIKALIGLMESPIPVLSSNRSWQTGLCSRLAECHKIAGNFPDAYLNAGKAVDLYPNPDGKSNFLGYANYFMEAIKMIPEFPVQHRAEAYKDAIDRLERIRGYLPDKEYAIDGHIAICYDGMGNRLKALKYHESAVLAHPRNDQQPDFDVYRNNFISDVCFLTQEAIPCLNGRRREQCIEQLHQVVNATARVGMKHLDLDDVKHEHQAAYYWFAKALGPRRLRIIKIYPN